MPRRQTLEEYSRGALPDAEVECFEEHLWFARSARTTSRKWMFCGRDTAGRGAAAEEQAVLAAKQGGVWSWFPHRHGWRPPRAWRSCW